jgi:hypothetical protein
LTFFSLHFQKLQYYDSLEDTRYTPTTKLLHKLQLFVRRCFAPAYADAEFKFEKMPAEKQDLTGGNCGVHMLLNAVRLAFGLSFPPGSIESSASGLRAWIMACVLCGRVLMS